MTCDHKYQSQFFNLIHILNIKIIVSAINICGAIVKDSVTSVANTTP